MPPFDAEYAVWPICPSNAAIDAVMTNAPRSPPSSGSFCDIAQAAWRSTRYMPIRLTPSVISNGIGFAGPSRPIVRSAQPTPAQLTQKRSSPSASTAPSTAALTFSSSCTSVS